MTKFICCAMLLTLAMPLRADIVVQQAYVPLMPPGSQAYAAYMDINNLGDNTRTISRISAQGFEAAHLHQTRVHEDVASMHAVHKLTLEPGESILLKPGALHVMLMKPLVPVDISSPVVLQLQFENGESVKVSAEVRAGN